MKFQRKEDAHLRTNKMPKKRVNKTKEQLVKEAENKKEVSRKRTLIVDSFYPALVKATISIDEAKALIQAMGSLVMERVLDTMRERKFSDISEQLLKSLTTDGERLEEIKALLATLEGENLFVSREIIEGMIRAIDAMITEEMRDRNLGTLKTNWEGHLN